ncbi:hypothetical protein BDR05DRAFT_79618 [Suillus weaverae]|nr:hypothetical protein BDR05DRAFT_79618 [Suillus weaverae]
MRHEQRDMSDAAFEVFRRICHRALAKRLLLERNASDDFENAMAQKLTEKYDSADRSLGWEIIYSMTLRYREISCARSSTLVSGVIALRRNSPSWFYYTASGRSLRERKTWTCLLRSKQIRTITRLLTRSNMRGINFRLRQLQYRRSLQLVPKTLQSVCTKLSRCSSSTRRQIGYRQFLEEGGTYG